MVGLLKILILGSKEYPVGSGSKADPLGSGGFETFTQNLSKYLALQGASPVVVTRLFAGQARAEKTGGITVHRLPWVPGFFFRTPSFNFFSFLKILSLDYDAAIASGIFAPLAAEAARVFNGRPVIVRPAGFGFKQPQYASFFQKLLKRLQAAACFNADAVVFLSDEEKKNFGDYFGRLPGNSLVIRTGVEIRAFDPQAVEKIKREYGGAGAKRIVFIGRLIETKGLDFLLDALEKLSLPGNKGWRLLLLGEGPLKQKLAVRVSASPALRQNVRFIGFKSNALEYVKASDVFVLPSLSEGLPIAMLEAMACGVPCIVTDIGLPVENNSTALVVQPKNSVELGKAIARLLSDDVLASKLAKGGLEKVRKDFSWKTASSEYLGLVGRVAKNP